MFWHFSEQFKDNQAVIFQDEILTYQQLDQKVEAFKSRLPETRSLAILCCQNDLDTLAAYIACLRKQVALMLVAGNAAESQLQLYCDALKPQVIIRGQDVSTTNDTSETIDHRLALLLSTSGSTGSPKQVALSYDNLEANARSICQYLPIESRDITLTTLPFQYSYGLSVINSHLRSGACLLLTDEPVTSRYFWNALAENPITSFAGVPHTYEMLNRLGFLRKSFHSLRYLTQAGGRLDDKLVMAFHNYLVKEHDPGQKQQAFYVMYGQTEATARMSYLDTNKLPEKVGAIGQAIPEGSFTLLDDDGQLVVNDDEPGELVYSGPNIMLGYATCCEGLRHFEPQATLHTGDIAKRDKDGDYVIVGRKKRIVKIFGLRINLDEVEQMLSREGHMAKVTGTDKKLFIALVREPRDEDTATDNDSASVVQFISKKINLHPSVIKAQYFASIPLKSNQKTDYSKLLADFVGNVAGNVESNAAKRKESGGKT